jgi:hypothetical protein
MKKLKTFLTTVFLNSFSVYGTISAEDPHYQVLNDYGHIQMRLYPALVAAETGINAN